MNSQRCSKSLSCLVAGIKPTSVYHRVIIANGIFSRLPDFFGRYKAQSTAELKNTKLLLQLFSLHEGFAPTKTIPKKMQSRNCFRSVQASCLSFRLYFPFFAREGFFLQVDPMHDG